MYPFNVETLLLLMLLAKAPHASPWTLEVLQPQRAAGVHTFHMIGPTCISIMGCMNIYIIGYIYIYIYLCTRKMHSLKMDRVNLSSKWL